jgi:pimeloyl-ACP methyl ester carboxylesterase
MDTVAEGFLDLSGRRTWYRVSGRRSSAPPLLMLHGGPGGATPDGMAAVDRIARDRQVIAYDQIDTGRSWRVGDPLALTVEAHVDELAEVRRALNLPEVHLWGQSWGGMLALSYALTQPDGLRSLTLASAPYSCPLWTEAATELRADLPARTLRALERCESTLLRQRARPIAPGPGPTSERVARDAARMVGLLAVARRPTVQRLARIASYLPALRRAAYPIVGLDFVQRHVYRGGLLPAGCLAQQAGMNLAVYEAMWGPSEHIATRALAAFDLTDRLPELDLPVLVTSGGHECVRPDHVRGLLDRVPGAEWELFADSAHCAEFEEPSRYAAALAGFLERVDAARAREGRDRVNRR